MVQAAYTAYVPSTLLFHILVIIVIDLINLFE